MSKDSTTQVYVAPAREKDEKTMPEWLKAELVVIRGPDEGKHFPVTGHCTVLGRSEDADICLSDSSVSRRHASVVYRSLEFRVRDLDSANGTLLNGSTVKEYAVRNRDKITVGESTLEFLVESMPRKHGSSPEEDEDA